MARQYNLKVPRFDPMKNIRTNSEGVLEKFCTKCKMWIEINYENWQIDSTRQPGTNYKSWCRCCLRKGTNEWAAKNRPLKTKNLQQLSIS
jgi:hypothetical protein